MITVYHERGEKSIAKSKKEIQRDYEKRTGYAAQKKYNSEKIKRISLNLNRLTDSDIIEKIEGVPNKQEFIKESIRKNM